jgi:hypothetical protein
VVTVPVIEPPFCTVYSEWLRSSAQPGVLDDAFAHSPALAPLPSVMASPAELLPPDQSAPSTRELFCRLMDPVAAVRLPPPAAPSGQRLLSAARTESPW